jgi:glycosyltransferase involved in cell wall biosynthesis
MKILIDFSQIPVLKNGVGVYALNTFRLLLEKDELNHYIVLIQDDDPDSIFFTNSKTKIVKVNAKVFRRFVPRIFLEQFFIPLYCLFNRIELIHSLHYSFPLIRFNVKQVVTIHDLTFFLYPEVHTLFKRLYFRLFIFLTVKFADEIVCVSQSTLNDLMYLFPRIKCGLNTIHLGVSPIRLSFNRLEKDFVFNKFKIDSEFILFVGVLEPRKNILNLLKAFHEIYALNLDLKLVIVGSKGWNFASIFELVKSLGLEDRIIFTGFVSEREKFLLISNCRLFVYPSFYEGFGLPVLEAFVYKVPTVTSNVSSMPEIAGDAALLIDPLSVIELAVAMERLLNDKVLLVSLVPKMELVVKRFSWNITADKTLKLYSSLKK